MAVPPKTSLRSSSRRSTFLPDQPPTAKSQLPAKHLGKRSHDAFQPNDVPQPIKRLKPNSEVQSQSKLATKTHLYNRFSILGKPTTGVTHTSPSSVPSPRITTAVQPLADGTLISNGHPQVEVEQTKVTGKATINGHGVEKTFKVVDKRTLRSQAGGSRSKSELSLYFPNYDELISTEPKESEFLSPETQILIVDEIPKTLNGTVRLSSLVTPISSFASNPQTANDTSELVYANTDILTDAVKLDFSGVDISRYRGSDPLSDDIYFKAHRRAERQEKQLRNIEKERAQHEKVQLERLLEGLKGHDWLRVMGISGITDSEKKSFEPKRDHFIREVRCLIEKFKRWKEEEKRRKVEKELSVRADDDEDEEEEEEDEEAEEYDETDPSSSQDVDALAALQLHNESLSASKPKRKAGNVIPGPLPPPPVEKPFTSFYSKPYIRDAAIGKHRRGRTRFAFGHPLPDFPEKSFRLPSEMLTEDAIAASARSRRRAKRDSKAG